VRLRVAAACAGVPDDQVIMNIHATQIGLAGFDDQAGTAFVRE
jgi:hypothetical protein